MAELNQFDGDNFKPKSFWSRPEGVTGGIFLAGILLGGGYLLFSFLPAIIALTGNILYLSGMLIALAAVVYMVLDPKMRNLVSYMYKSVMRTITGFFVTIDPIGILKNYVESLQDNLRKMSKQIGALRAQMRKLATMMDGNNAEIEKNIKLASAAKAKNMDQQMMLSTRKAARLKETNSKYKALHSKMEIMYRILTKMYNNSELILEDTRDQVQLKEQEYKVIKTSHSAMKSAMNVIAGDKDKKMMFDMAVEKIADDVSNKVGEMERFMEMSSSLMDSVDLQNGVFEEEGLKMLEKYEKESTILLMGNSGGTLDINEPIAKPEMRENKGGSNYDNLFE